MMRSYLEKIKKRVKYTFSWNEAETLIKTIFSKYYKRLNHYVQTGKEDNLRLIICYSFGSVVNYL